ncbi:MAG: FHA domain-containing protein [Eubacterium sp.]|nr:FHA domain-containing protein [Eubacterium sp.]
MEQKRTMKLWQMIALVVLLAGVTISMFFPVINPTGEKIVNSMESILEEYKDDDDLGEKCTELLDKIEDDDKREKAIDDFDEKLADLEEAEDGISLKISGVDYMTGNFLPDEFYEKMDELLEKDEDDLSESDEMILDIYGKYKASQVILGIMYFLPLLFIIMTILLYCFKGNKYIAAIINAIFSLIGTIMYFIVYFGTSSMLGDKLNGIAESFVSDMGINGSTDAVEDFVAEFVGVFWSALRGSGFLITGILFLLVLIMSIVTMVGGNQESSEIPVGPNGWGGNGDIPGGSGDWGGNGNIPGGPGDWGGNGKVPDGPGGNNQFGNGNKKIATVPMGRVKCIKGSSNTKGYKFPQENKIIVGTNPSKCQLVFLNAPHVSNIHCSIRYDAERNTYLIKDHSSNGTYVNNVRLPKDQMMEYPSGTILTLADGSNQLQLGE